MPRAEIPVKSGVCKTTNPDKQKPFLMILLCTVGVFLSQNFGVCGQEICCQSLAVIYTSVHAWYTFWHAKINAGSFLKHSYVF